MFEKKRRPDAGDVTGPPHGDFTDWDNPEDSDWDDEDEREGAPEGYYEEGEDGEWYVPDEDDPDYDLTEAAGYSDWEAKRGGAIVPQWVIVLFALLLIIALLFPMLIRIN
jgi:hypothetical protein